MTNLASIGFFKRTESGLSLSMTVEVFSTRRELGTSVYAKGKLQVFFTKVFRAPLLSATDRELDGARKKLGYLPVVQSYHESRY